jgi:CRISPR/Cas system-associated exonuclease Cas4 (RecB family)
MFLWLEYVGADKEEKLPPDKQLIMDSGTVVEQQYQYYQHTMAIDGGYSYDSNYPVWRHGRLREEIGLGGDADGLMDRELKIGRTKINLRAIFEYKSINRDGFSGLRTKPKITYVRQVQAYLASMDIPLGVIVYINRDNGEPRHFFVWYDPRLWDPIEERLRRLKAMADNYKEPEKHTGKSCRWCKFFAECDPHPRKSKRALRS